MFVRYDESALSLVSQTEGVIRLTKVNGPYSSPGPQIDHPLWLSNWGKVEFSVQELKEHLMHHVQTIAFQLVIRE